MRTVLLIQCVLTISFVYGGRVLFHCPTPTYSHNIAYEPIVKALAEKGHEVVFISSYPMKSLNGLSKVRQIDVSETKEYWKANFDGAHSLSAVDAVIAFSKVMPGVTDMQLMNPEVRSLITNKSEHFDLIITECVFYHITFGWAYRFKAPSVGILSLDGFYDGLDMIGNPSHPYLTYSMLIDFPVGAQMTFINRMKSIYFGLACRYVAYVKIKNIQQSILEKHFGKSVPPVYDLAKNMSLMIVNYNEAINPRPKVPKLIYMNMLHIKPPKELPSPLKDFLESGPEGVVYFSLGSNIKSASLPQERIFTILQAFGEVGYKVLWKWEQRQLAGKPPNVMLCQWCPQQDILAHKNVRLFITQGGMQSTEEAIYFRVPMLGLPLFVDQRNNVFNMVSRGCAEKLDLMTMTTQELKDTIIKIMTQKSYQECMNRTSELIKDQPEKPLDRVIWWLEYVMRHKGTSHLQVPEVPWYLYFMLDALAFLIAVLGVLYYCTKILYKMAQRAVAKILHNYTTRPKTE